MKKSELKRFAVFYQGHLNRLKLPGKTKVVLMPIQVPFAGYEDIINVVLIS
jgi:hypothetical protein